MRGLGFPPARAGRTRTAPRGNQTRGSRKSFRISRVYSFTDGGIRSTSGVTRSLQTRSQHRLTRVWCRNVGGGAAFLHSDLFPFPQLGNLGICSSSSVKSSSIPPLFKLAAQTSPKPLTNLSTLGENRHQKLVSTPGRRSQMAPSGTAPPVNLWNLPPATAECSRREQLFPPPDKQDVHGARAPSWRTPGQRTDLMGVDARRSETGWSYRGSGGGKGKVCD